MVSAEATRDLESVYAELEAELEKLRPRCELSGRCCRFKDYGHQLWTTRLELQYLLNRHPLPESIPDGVCPYFKEGLCSVRGHRMLECRIFFCDEAYKPSMSPLYERYHRKLKAIHQRHGIPYEFFEFMGEINRLRAEGAGSASTNP